MTLLPPNVRVHLALSYIDTRQRPISAAVKQAHLQKLCLLAREGVRICIPAEPLSHNPARQHRLVGFAIRVDSGCRK